MTLAQAIRMGDDMRKANSFSDELKTQWINEVEGTITTDVHLLSIDEVVVLNYEEHKDFALSAKPPYDKVYWAYLVAMIDYANGEYDRYENSCALYNKFIDEYKNWVSRNIRPQRGHAVEMGYYLSAYAIAVLRGFRGTEEQWLASLHGEDGEDGVDGRNGGTFAPIIDKESGILSWSNDAGLDNPEPVDIVALVLAALDGSGVALPYEGEYEVTPSLVNEIILATTDRFLSDDVVINPIPMSRVANEYGGETLYIG